MENDDGQDIIETILKTLVNERVFNIAYKKTRESSDYDNWTKDSIELGIAIVNLLGDNKKLFDHYEELYSLRKVELLKNAYEQGFKDGITVTKILFK